MIGCGHELETVDDEDPSAVRCATCDVPLKPRFYDIKCPVRGCDVPDVGRLGERQWIGDAWVVTNSDRALSSQAMADHLGAEHPEDPAARELRSHMLDHVSQWTSDEGES